MLDFYGQLGYGLTSRLLRRILDVLDTIETSNEMGNEAIIEMSNEITIEVGNATRNQMEVPHETDIALGGTERLNATVANVVKRDKPRVIFLIPSSIPQVIGTDLFALSEELQSEYPDTRLIPFGYGGFDVTQHRGIQEALLLLAKALPRDRERTSQPTYNIIGSCADLFRFQADAQEIMRIMEGAFGIKSVCVLSSNTSINEIEEMGGAHIQIHNGVCIPMIRRLSDFGERFI